MERNIELWEDVYQWNRENNNHLIYPDEEVIRIIKKFFLPKGVAKVLDAGCGAGRHTLALLREGLSVTAMDSSPSALKITENLVASVYPNVRYVESNIASLPFENGYFDAILCWGVLHYLNDVEFAHAVDEFHRVLKSGGVLGLTLRSVEDSECNHSCRDIMQVSQAFESKGMGFRYFDEADIGAVLKPFTAIQFGHKTRTTFEDKTRKIAHWFVVAEKP
jgi:ubiquinone/menaquinone biosynthesis C-methylase UbiE